MRGVERIPWLYDLFMELVEWAGLGAWRQRLVRRARGRVLEVGCGTGRNLHLYRESARVMAVELHFELLAAARRRAPGQRLVLARAERLPFRRAVFDTVVSSLVFCSVDEPRSGMEEVRRVLASGGRLLMLEHVRHHRPALAGLQDLLQPAWTWISGGCRPNRDTESTVEAAGFVIDPARRWARGTMRLFEAAPRPDGPDPRPR